MSRLKRFLTSLRLSPKRALLLELALILAGALMLGAAFLVVGD